MGSIGPIDSFLDFSIDTERLLLRPCRMEDADALTALMTPQISDRLATWPTPLSLSETQTILRNSRQHAMCGTSFPAVVIEKASSTIIGWCKLDCAEGQADMGYWIGEAYQRRGFALEVAKGAIGFAFETLDCHQVRAGARVDNAASLSLLKKLGMSPQGIQSFWTPARQRYEDCAFWQLNRDDWRRPR
ncbi:GNAT family N-acetyltransferase [Shimia sp.]|uniref:GNAT family N-acetyltransferase n=1 Tax=unclassified Shimia TaxID=2630038 RepID=UPI0025E0EB5E|nr:GNAT family N-acetyltransferase [Shimia sp.]MCH2067806.1 GNAT family N-acetyltransferase [Shimia sp.]